MALLSEAPAPFGEASQEAVIANPETLNVLTILTDFNDANNDNTTDSEYGDSSDMMGCSRNWMKFSAPHAEDKGWNDPVDYEIRTITPSVSPQNLDLIPMDEEVWDWPGLRAIKVERNANSDYYISYRLAEGEYNNVSSAYRKWNRFLYRQQRVIGRNGLRVPGNWL